MNFMVSFESKVWQFAMGIAKEAIPVAFEALPLRSVAVLCTGAPAPLMASRGIGASSIEAKTSEMDRRLGSRDGPKAKAGWWVHRREEPRAVVEEIECPEPNVC